MDSEVTWRWQDKAVGARLDDEHITRRVFGPNDIRFDGIGDLLMRARGASVLDVGCNRGHVLLDFAYNGARLVHGVDVYGPGIDAAKHFFAELPHLEHRFEAIDLAKKPAGLTEFFGDQHYDIVLFLGTYHKLIREMKRQALDELVRDIGNRALVYLAWSGYPKHLPELDNVWCELGFNLIHRSELAQTGRPACIWRRV